MHQEDAEDTMMKTDIYRLFYIGFFKEIDDNSSW